MIKIDSQNIEEIANTYYDKISKEVVNRSTYLSMFIEVINNHCDASHLLSYKSIKGNVKKSLVNVLLDYNHKIKKVDELNHIEKDHLSDFARDNFLQLSNIVKALQDYSQIKSLILAEPHNAISAEEEFLDQVNLDKDIAKLDHNFRELIVSILKYSLFNKYAYDISCSLDINTCPYCNRIPINTVIHKSKGKIIRPVFDHFFSQKDHPLLSLSFYNLIPSCYYCNSIVSDRRTTSCSVKNPALTLA